MINNNNIKGVISALIIFLVIFFGVMWGIHGDYERVNLFNDACHTCGGISHSDYTIAQSVNSYLYHIVECDRGMQIRIFYNLGVKDKWGNIYFLEKTLINCEDQRNKDHTISFPEIGYPNSCSESSTSEECHIEGYLRWKN